MPPHILAYPVRKHSVGARVATTLLLAACVTSKPIEINSNEWLIQSRQLDGGAAMRNAIEQAKVHCGARHQEVKVLESGTNGASRDAYTRTNLRFTCIPKPDSTNQKTVPPDSAPQR